MEIISAHFFSFCSSRRTREFGARCCGTVVPFLGESLNSFSQANDVLQQARTGDGFALSFFRVEK